MKPLKTIYRFNKRKDWKGFNLNKKALILFLWVLFPYKMWKRNYVDVLKALELQNVSICNDKKLMDFFVEAIYNYAQPKTLMSLREMINLYNLIKKTLQIDGDIAEVGVFKGGSAKIICEVKENKKLHLFDTFKGLPPTNSRYDTLTEGIMHETSLEQVKNYLSGYKNVYFYQGIFPDTAKKLTNTQFSFVNLDVDIYESTKKSLEFFYPRLNKGGIILTHDYNDVLTPGVKIAFNDFFTSKPEQIIELWDTQAMIIKI